MAASIATSQLLLEYHQISMLSQASKYKSYVALVGAHPPDGLSVVTALYATQFLYTNHAEVAGFQTSAYISNDIL